MNPYSPINNIAILKSRKTGMTTALEGVIAFWMFAWPSDIVYATATESLAKQWQNETLMHTVSSMGYMDRLIPLFSSGRNKRSAIAKGRVEYMGGHLDVISSGSLDARRQKNARIIVLDEVDGLPEQTTTGEGSYIEILRGHQMSWGSRRKFIAFSSPTTYETSAIWKLYNEGDCRKFFVPCPACGEYIELKDSDQASCGLKAETKAGQILDVYYLCEHCKEPIRDNDKMMMYSDNPRCKKHPEKILAPAHWRPTRTIADLYSRSYSLNSLYSPIGAVTFKEVYQAKIKAEAEGPDAMRSFTNLHLGLPYMDTGARVKIDTVLNLRCQYKSGTVPKDVIFLTMAADVQRGSEKDENNKPRIEIEVLGICKNRITFSIVHKTFYGDTDNEYSGAWVKLDEWITKTGLTFTRTDGQELNVRIIGIDAGDAFEGRAETVYNYCAKYNSCFPVKGFFNLKAGKKEKADLPGGYRRYRAARIGGADGPFILEINTANYKAALFSRLKIAQQPGDQQQYGFCGFPSDYKDAYFQSLVSEEKRIDGSFHKIHTRNEALDLRVYCLALEDFFIDTQVTAWRAWYQSQGYKAIQLTEITSVWVLDQIAEHPNKSFPIK
jgi:phage terminase large subunit GpA-like protein